jgi:hypothetical protein
MMPQPQSDYFAKSLAYRLINETRRMQEDLVRLMWDREPRLAEQRIRAWEDEIHRACHEMNEAANYTIKRQQEEIYRLTCLLPSPWIVPAPTPDPPPAPDPASEYGNDGRLVRCSECKSTSWTSHLPHCSKSTLNQPVDPAPTVDELYRELKGDNLPEAMRDLIAEQATAIVIETPPPDPTPPTCSCVPGKGADIYCEIHGNNVPF